jgi:hypothetical protein
VSIITVGKTKTESKKIRDGIGALFDTEIGKGLVGYVMGACLPYVKEHFPERYQSIVDELATEFRIEGLAVVGDEAIKGLLPLLGLAKTGIIEAMNGLVSGESAHVRVDTDKPAALSDRPEPVTTEETTEETPKIETVLLNKG